MGQAMEPVYEGLCGLLRETLRPFGVDAASRLEARPGVKDPEKVRRYLEAVRLCETTSTP